MNITVYQQITVNNLCVEGISNSSVLQIGTAGLIKTRSDLFNTGGFTGPAPEMTPPGLPGPLVPFASGSYAGT